MSQQGPILAVLAALAAPAWAAAPPVDEFEGRVDVVEVDVSVEVRDRDGQPIRGLTRDRFRLFDQGSEREIVDFEVVDLETIPATGAPSAEAAAAPVARPRRILMLFDLTFSSPIAVLRAREAARRVVVESLHPSDLVAVVTFSIEYGPRLLVTFTPDRAQVARAIDSLSFDRAAEYRSLDPLRFIAPFTPNSASDALQQRLGAGTEQRRELEQVLVESQAIIAESVEREGRRFDISRVTSWTRGLGELMRFLAAVDGRKQVLLFSEGYDSRLLLGRADPGEAGSNEETERVALGEFWRVDSDMRFGNTTLMGEVGRLVEEMRRADCVVNAVDIGGLRAGGEGGSAGRSAGEDALFYYANESGGQLFREANDLGSQIRDFLVRTATSYVLTFRAEDVPLDGSWRRLRVEISDGRGMRVVHRAGWYAPRPFPELHPFERDLLTADAIALAEARDEIHVEVLAAPFRAGDSAYVPVILEIDGSSLIGGTGGARRVDLYVYATTRQGEFRSFFHRQLQIDAGDDTAAITRSGLKYYGHLELAPDDYVLRVLVRDGAQGRIGARALSLRVPNFAAGEATLLPPFFVDTLSRWNLVRERTSSSGDGRIVYPFVVGGEPFIPKATPSFERGEPAHVRLVGYHLASDRLELAGVWLRGDGEVPVDLRAVSFPTQVEGYRQWSAELDLAGLESGEHRLRLWVADPATGVPLVTTETSLRIEPGPVAGGGPPGGIHR